MNLDQRIIKGKRVLTPFDIEEAEQFNGLSGYFSNVTDDFKHLENAARGVLILGFGEHPYRFVNDEEESNGCLYFLPAEWVKESEKKYRPFSIEDWKFKHSVGDTILYRYKGTYCDDHREAEVMYLGYVKPLDGVTDEAGKGELVLGNESLGLQNLFNNYEIWVDGGWKPFGIEVEE